MANVQLTREVRRQARGVSLMGLSEQRLKAGRMRLPGAVRGSKCPARPPGVWVRGSREGRRQRLSSREQSRGLAEAARRPFWAELQEWQRALPVPPAAGTSGVRGHRAPTAHAVELLLRDWPLRHAVHETLETP